MINKVIGNTDKVITRNKQAMRKTGKQKNFVKKILAKGERAPAIIPGSQIR